MCHISLREIRVPKDNIALKMGQTSKTGLLASPTKKIVRYEQTKVIQLKAIAKPAPYVLKPYAGIYNPYSYGCSLLCNHPTDCEVKDLLKKAKGNWAGEGRNVLLAEEIHAIREGLEHLGNSPDNIQHIQKSICIPQVESVPEELFRRYTETDSRPLTPAPTLASGATRASGSRRCVTPDLIPIEIIREKTLLVLDLRRSHSQETLSMHGSSSVTKEPPLINIQRIPTRSTSLDNIQVEETNRKTLMTPTVPKRPKSGNKKSTKQDNEENNSDKDSAESDEVFVKRRGKKRRKKGRDGSRGPPGFQPSLDPETQVATVGSESANTSARPSLVPDTEEIETPVPTQNRRRINLKYTKSFEVDSYLDIEILKYLRRELTAELVDTELDDKRRKALEEALKTLSKGKHDCQELIVLQKELKVSPVNVDLWIALPRTFSRSSASFELPMDSRTLNTMTPLQYVRNHVNLSSQRKLLYNCIFRRYKIELDDEHSYERKVSADVLPECLGLVMGKTLTTPQLNYIRSLLGWQYNDEFDFKTCCGIFALCERLLASQFCPLLPDRNADPCLEIEAADFEALERKLHGRTVDERLTKILDLLKTI
ncbi:unnamed protein product [Acanthoscelides obtectus]|uniref:Uncharacterized protein n=2 Tax=Acanthoscelides obtectus TaxID=200917 RepID=A0A9P0P2Z2_ACAOB|nr:unnamed protein product [Acanthoscelides obtectus]CAK1666874.1 hypothetical protein AOBTE_LOCUS25533 [Acanthoscelides obtectus]